MHPHFLFNTLNSIAGLKGEDETTVDTMLARLSELLRGSLETGAVQEVPLSEELRLLLAYLAIQRMRFGDRLRWASTPCCVERHSFRRASCSRWPKARSATASARRLVPAALRFACRQRRGRLRIDVTDEGPGPPQPLREGYGLRNTRSRLQALYGEEATLSVVPAKPRGARARLDLPLREAFSS